MAGSAMATAVQSGFEDRTRHKIALRLLPFLFILYIVNYVDRTNLGFAAIGMARDLGFSDRVFGLGRASSLPVTWRCRFLGLCWLSDGVRAG